MNSFSHAKTVRLITIGPGDAFWSAFGHTAIAIDNDVYGFGYFSFKDDVISEFINNRMQYELGLSEINHELLLAKQQNRDFKVLNLNLSPAEVNQIESFLKWHIRPENQAYRYDYFLNNCSTKVRDILNEAWQGQLMKLSSDSSKNSYISQTFPAKHQALMNLGLAMGYGWPAYVERSQWELMAFPVFFETQLIDVVTDKVNSTKTLYQSVPKSSILSFFLTHWALFCYALIWVLFLATSRFKKTATKIWFVWHAIIGIVLLSLWFLTPHQVASNNFNLLLFSPIGLLVFKPKLLRNLISVSYVLWLVIALYLNAWYLVGLLIPGLMALKNLNDILSADKPSLTFGGVS